MSPMIGQLGDEEEARYHAWHRSAMALIESTLRALRRRRETPGVSQDELNEIDRELPERENERATLERRRLAFIRGQAAVTPPTQAQVEQVKALATEVDRLIAGAAAAGQLLAVARKGLEAAEGIHGIGPPDDS
jgi:hypothetical protein